MKLINMRRLCKLKDNFKNYVTKYIGIKIIYLLIKASKYILILEGLYYSKVRDDRGVLNDYKLSHLKFLIPLPRSIDGYSLAGIESYNLIGTDFFLERSAEGFRWTKLNYPTIYNIYDSDASVMVEVSVDQVLSEISEDLALNLVFSIDNLK